MSTSDLNLLRAFAAVVETGSYTRAAERLHCPKSWVSRAVTSLEDELGVRLLHRTTRSIAMSTAGTTLYERIKAPLAALSTSGEELTEQAGVPTGTLRVTATVDFGATLLSGIVARFCEAYPGVNVDMRLSNQVVDVVGEGYDIALRFASKQMPDSGLYAKKLIAFDMGVFASPAYLAREGTPSSAAALEGRNWIKFRPITDDVVFDNQGASVKVRTSGRIQCDDMMAVHALMLAGSGLAILPEFVTDADVRAHRAIRVLPELRLRSGHLWFVAPSTKLLPSKVVAFRDHLTASLARCPSVEAASVASKAKEPLADIDAASATAPAAKARKYAVP